MGTDQGNGADCECAAVAVEAGPQTSASRLG